MAFPAEGGTREQLDDALTKIRQAARTAKTHLQSVRDQSAAASLQVMVFVALMDNLSRLDGDMARFAQTPGLAAHAKAAYNDANFDIAAEYVTMRDALRSVVAWLAANIPTDGRWVQAFEIVNGRSVQRTITPAQTATFRTVADQALATID